MQNDVTNNEDTKAGDASGDENKKEETVLPVQNPLNPNDNKQITQEDLENEQKYKEALTERD